jgi:uncharacterized membrane protein
MDLIPSSAPHWHLLLNHFPSIGTVIGVLLLLYAFYRKSEELIRVSLMLFVVLGLLAIPTYITGAATRWAIRDMPGISGETIAAHQDAAMLAFIAALVTGWVSWFALWQYRRFSRPYRWSLPAVLVLSVLTLALMVVTGNLGGHINHPEISTGALPSAPGRTAAIAAWVMDGAWTWPTLESAHFIGMSILFGVMLLVTLRVLGVGRSVPFTALHRLLPLGTFGLMINVTSGMLFFVADSGRYSAMTNSFFPKMALIAIGGVAVLYFTIVDKSWDLKAGDDAPLSAKAMAVATILMWSGVIIYGRLLPYLEGG